MNGSAIPRRSLHDELVERVRRQIVEGVLEPGEKISEKDLCAAYAVSRTPLREALKVLAREGLVVLTPHRGAHVSRLTISDIEEAFPVIGALGDWPENWPALRQQIKRSRKYPLSTRRWRPHTETRTGCDISDSTRKYTMRWLSRHETRL